MHVSIARRPDVDYTMLMVMRERGFTIVELLIVIVVIAILAAVTTVAYNGVSARASYSKARSDFAAIRRAIDLYKVDNDKYPLSQNAPSGCTYGWCGWDQVTGDLFIPGLSPKYLQTIPQLSTNLASNDTFLYQSTADGKDYQLIRYKGDGLNSIEKQNNELLMTGQGYDGLGWGYKSDPTSVWW